MKNQRELFEALLSKKVLINADGLMIALCDMDDMVHIVGIDNKDVREGYYSRINPIEWKVVKDTGFIVVNGKLVPHPITDINSKLLYDGVTVYYPTIHYLDDIVTSYSFKDVDVLTGLVDKGLVHLSYENALIHAEALLSYSEYEN